MESVKKARRDVNRVLKKTAGLPVNSAEHANTKKETAALSDIRERLKRKQRRIIYNNDSGDIYEEGACTPEGFLSKRFKPILNTQVDSVFYCTGATTMFCHLARVGETYGEFCYDNSMSDVILRENIRALKEAGHDTLELAVEFCHKNNLEIFFSHRINDIHDTLANSELSRWKRNHPEYLMGKSEDVHKVDSNSPRYWWSALDFERPEVIDYLCCIVKDVCERYDIDGIEIDYFRSPMFFRPNLDFKPATPDQIKILTDFQRRLRAITYEAGNERGRPILMAVRTPATLETCLHVGIDVVLWLKENLTDILTVGGGYAPFSEPISEIIEISHKYHTPVYPTLSASRLPVESLPAWRAAASNMWQSGADGILTFNIFPSGPDQRFIEIGSPNTLEGLEKEFIVNVGTTTEGDLVQAIDQRQNLPVAVPGDGSIRDVNLKIGDDIPSASLNGKLRSAVMIVKLSKPEAADILEVRLNGAVLSPVEKKSEGEIEFKPKAAQYRVGSNKVSFRTINIAIDPTDIISIRVYVTYL